MTIATKKPWYISWLPKNGMHWIWDTIIDLIMPFAKKTKTTLDDEALEMARKLGHKAIDDHL